MEIKEIYINLHLKQADAKESADIIYLRPVCDAYR